MSPGPLFLALCLAVPGPVLATEEDQELVELYQFNCLSCHGSEVYTRTDRKVSSLEGLKNQVQRCEQSLGLKWFQDDIDKMAIYLNTHYYKFAP